MFFVDKEKGMKNLRLLLLFFLFSNALLGMEDEIQATQLVLRKRSKSKMRKLRRRYAQQKHQHELGCSLCRETTYIFKAVCAGLSEDGEKIEEAEVRKIISMLFSPAPISIHEDSPQQYDTEVELSWDFLKPKESEIEEHHSWIWDSFEIPDYAFAQWRKRRDERIAKAKLDAKND